MSTLIQYGEIIVLVLTIASGLGAIVANVIAFLDHGHPDARRAWITRAVQLATAIRDDAEKILGSPVQDTKVLKDIASTAENYLGTHGVHLHVDVDTVQLVLQELRQLGSSLPKA